MKTKFELIKYTLSLCCMVLVQFTVKGQPTEKVPAPTLPVYRIAVFAPLYLDSVFTGTTYRYTVKTFPKFVLPAFDFVQGVQMAVDSIKRYDVQLTTKIYDSKSKTRSVLDVINSGALDSMDFILGPVKDMEYYQLARFAAERKIPFISASYPNDGGIRNDPYLIIQNTTLQTHCEGIFSYLMSRHGNEKIILARRNSDRGDVVVDYFNKLNYQNKDTLMNLDVVMISDENDFSSIISHLDSTRETIVIGASLNRAFAEGLVKQLSTVNKKYPTQLIGMPNWDGIIFKPEYLKDYGVIYTTPFYNSKWQPETKRLSNIYYSKYKGNPSDMVYKAYDMTKYFLSVMFAYPKDMMNHINDGSTRIFSDPYYQANYGTLNPELPDNFENKRIIFMKKINDTVIKAW